jgi:hypothetical protein
MQTAVISNIYAVEWAAGNRALRRRILTQGDEFASDGNVEYILKLQSRKKAVSGEE